ncbi:hypothetical protein KKH27_12700, partial [bacterium]|nr:hypothetical protein [bacterium]MBU1982993.1 hypothetical protein [bacterium]
TGGGVSHLHGDSLSFTNNEGGGASALLLKGVNSISPVEARVINCTFAGNVRSLSGEGPALRGSAVQQISGAGPVLQRCLFHDNSNAGGAASAILLENSAGTTVELRNLTAVLNQADSAAIRLNAPAILRNSIVIENGGARQIGGTNPAVAYCLTSDTQYHGAGGSFYADPAFEDFWERDYRLSAGSFAINRGDPNQAYNDPDGTRADVGAFVAESFSAEIESLFDVPHDNGRQLMLEWLPSAGDDARQGIVSYLIYRKVNLAILENFELVATVPAARLEGYGRIVPTLADSNASGIRYYSFFVRAQSVNPLAYWDTPQDSGYSVDNLTPATPQQLAGMEIAVGAQLTWEAVPDTDVAYYAVYRGAVPFDPDTASAVYGTSAEPVFVDSMETGSFFYAVRAVDRNGNRSQPSGVVAVEVGIVHPPLALTIAVEESQLRLRWQSSPGAVQYRIFRSLQADGPMDYVDSTSDTMYVITDIPIRAFYFVTAER